MTDIPADAVPPAAPARVDAESAVPRIATLDIVRGIAVMGILAMNIIAFAMPFSAYTNPLAYGMEGPADFWSWVVSFIFIDGKMRGLFSFLFGASTLLVIERAQAAGQSPARVHYARMIWLLVFGLLHFYLIWFGDILAAYALTGLLLYLFRNLDTRTLVAVGIGLVLLQTLIFTVMAFGIAFLTQQAAMPGAPADVIESWRELERQFGTSDQAALADKLAMFRGAYPGIVGHRLGEQAMMPFTGVFLFGAETLAYMLFGMAALRSGFFRGEWAMARYRKWALTGFAVAVPVYALMAWILSRDGFTVPMTFVGWAAVTPFRPVMVVAIAALIVILTRNGGALVDRIAAAGRAAFTNYLGTSILMTTFFYGYGLGFYGTMSRIELWLVVAAMWAIMLLWSKPWLDRYRYGPFEWLWRSLSRLRLEPMRKS
jgi:uncharacterized protein